MADGFSGGHVRDLTTGALVVVGPNGTGAGGSRELARQHFADFSTTLATEADITGAVLTFTPVTVEPFYLEMVCRLNNTVAETLTTARVRDGASGGSSGTLRVSTTHYALGSVAAVNLSSHNAASALITPVAGVSLSYHATLMTSTATTTTAGIQYAPAPLTAFLRAVIP